MWRVPSGGGAGCSCEQRERETDRQSPNVQCEKGRGWARLVEADGCICTFDQASSIYPSEDKVW